LAAAATANNGGNTQQPATKKRKATNYSNKFCEYCGIKGHVTMKRKSCTASSDVNKKFRTDGSSLAMANEDTAGDIPTAADAAPAAPDILVSRDPNEDEADDFDADDSHPWDHGDPINISREDSAGNIYEDAGTWSSDEEDVADVSYVGGGTDTVI
jgi:hypothetical protein